MGLNFTGLELGLAIVVVIAVVIVLLVNARIVNLL